mgnify:CR=1 FL=1
MDIPMLPFYYLSCTVDAEMFSAKNINKYNEKWLYHDLQFIHYFNDLYNV